jgi:urease accessory protein
MEKYFKLILQITAFFFITGHTGFGPVSGFEAGFLHPVSGLDHILAMVSVGILAAQLGGKSIWLIPLSFVSMMIIGASFGFFGMAIPFVEYGIIGSVIVLGLAIAFGHKTPLTLAITIVGISSVFHGNAHGLEMPNNISGIEYGLGFTIATALLHMTGILINLFIHKAQKKVASFMVRATGAVISVVGIALFSI